MKRVAIGRRNWLFADNDRAAAHAATLYSLIASAERHGLDPQAYLTASWPTSHRPRTPNLTGPAGRLGGEPTSRSYIRAIAALLPHPLYHLI